MLLGSDLQVLIDAVPAGGYFLLPDEVQLSKPLVISKPLTLEGRACDIAQPNMWNSAPADFIQVNSPAVRLAGLSLRSTLSGTDLSAGIGIVINPGSAASGDGTYPVWIERVFMSNVWDGVVVRSGNWMFIEGGKVVGAVRDGIRSEGGLALTIDSFLTAGCGRCGFNICGGSGPCGAFWLRGYQSFEDRQGIYCGVDQIFGSQVTVDMPHADAIIVDRGAGEIDFEGSWACGSSEGFGLNLIYTRGFNWVGGLVRSNWGGGIHVSKASRCVSICHARISANGLNNPAHPPGILIDHGMDLSTLQIADNQLGADHTDPAGVQLVGVSGFPAALPRNISTDPRQRLVG